MNKIKDRITLGIVSGLIGTIVKTASDELFLRQKASKRSFRVTAAGVWVNTKRQASTPYGQILGAIMDLGLGMVGAVAQVYILSKTGKNNLFAKGSLFGMTFGSTITAMLSGFGSNKVKPKDAKSNLTYIFSSGIFGLVTTYAAALLGDDSLWDAPPANNYLPPTKPTTAEKTSQVPIPSNEPSNSHEWSIMQTD
ncbi:hypothetical protein [Desulfosporosinus fructosivorans]|uniref:hypothetical protein n=1 Tax=Desulfosporosinus fructosivorans TaxID=2018669 RepID=UPI001A7E7198|nr:hypothetical protein [Desulfosporosinus fructosivorans]